MTGWSALARAADACGPEQPLYGLPRYAQALPLGQQVGEVVIIHAGVACAGQGEDATTDGLSNPAGGAAAVTMGQGGETILPGLRQQATDVTNREAQEPRGIRHGETPLENLNQEMCSLLFSPAQGDCPPVHAPRVTESPTR
jgi:hypothetical protein